MFSNHNLSTAIVPTYPDNDPLSGQEGRRAKITETQSYTEVVCRADDHSERPTSNRYTTLLLALISDQHHFCGTIGRFVML